MSRINSVSKRGGTPRFLFLLGMAFLLWGLMPFVFDLASPAAQAHPGPRPTLVAALTGEPIGEATPRGSAAYFVATTGTPEPARKLTVSVSNVNLPAGTQLEVNLNDTPIGTITLDNHRRGSLMLSTSNGGTVPEVVDGDTLTVGAAPAAGGVTYLSGSFAPPPSPSPTSTHTPWPSPSHTPWPSPSHTPWPSPSQTPGPARIFASRLSGANEVPPVTTDARGCGFVSLNSAETQIRVTLAFRNLSSAVTAITINGPASTTENGPVIFTLTLPEGNHFPIFRGTFDVTAEQIADLRAGLWYMQVTSTDNPDGEIRGQLNGLTPPHGGGHGPHHGGDGDGGGGGGHHGDLTSVLQGSDDVESGSRAKNDGYIPVPFDFDEDGITDIAVFRESTGNWHITRSSDGMTVTYRINAPLNTLD